MPASLMSSFGSLVSSSFSSVLRTTQRSWSHSCFSWRIPKSVVVIVKTGQPGVTCFAYALAPKVYP